ncbi:MAG: Nif3-like dinuclear metal center hexameric protein [Haloferacaceae archaeon]
MDLDELVARLDDRLRTDAYADLDASANGLQVDGPDAVERVALAVDAARATADEAVARDADLLLVHHGLVWGGLDRVTGQTYDRLEPLFAGDCGLYVSHLPLDGHAELGNAAGVCDVLSADDREPFGTLGAEPIGLRGRVTAQSVDAVVDRLDAVLDPERGVHLLPFGPDEVTDVAVVTGSGADLFGEASEAGVDLFVTGEGKQQLYHEAREAGVNVALAGHYATETFGVRAVGEVVEGWGVETTWIDHPTGL